MSEEGYLLIIDPISEVIKEKRDFWSLFKL